MLHERFAQPAAGRPWIGYFSGRSCPGLSPGDVLGAGGSPAVANGLVQLSVPRAADSHWLINIVDKIPEDPGDEVVNHPLPVAVVGKSRAGPVERHRSILHDGLVQIQRPVLLVLSRALANRAGPGTGRLSANRPATGVSALVGYAAASIRLCRRASADERPQLVDGRHAPADTTRAAMIGGALERLKRWR